MGKRNRTRHQTDGFVIFRPIGSGIVVVTALALLYVWLGCRCETLGKEIQKQEQNQGLLQLVPEKIFYLKILLNFESFRQIFSLMVFHTIFSYKRNKNTSIQLIYLHYAFYLVNYCKNLGEPLSYRYNHLASLFKLVK